MLKSFIPLVLFACSAASITFADQPLRAPDETPILAIPYSEAADKIQERVTVYNNREMMHRLIDNPPALAWSFSDNVEARSLAPVPFNPSLAGAQAWRAPASRFMLGLTTPSALVFYGSHRYVYNSLWDVSYKLSLPNLWQHRFGNHRIFKTESVTGELLLSRFFSSRFALTFTPQLGYSRISFYDDLTPSPDWGDKTWDGLYGTATLSYLYLEQDPVVTPNKLTYCTHPFLKWLSRWFGSQEQLKGFASQSMISLTQGKHTLLTIESHHAYYARGGLTNHERLLAIHLDYDLVHALKGVSGDSVPLDRRLFYSPQLVRGIYNPMEKDLNNPKYMKKDLIDGYFLGGVQRLSISTASVLPINKLLDLKLYSQHCSLGQNYNHLSAIHHGAELGVGFKTVVPFEVCFVRFNKNPYENVVRPYFALKIYVNSNDDLS